LWFTPDLCGESALSPCLPPGVLEGHLDHVQPVEAALELGLEEPKVVVVVDRQAP
jgi:hypothetical protein